MYKHLVLLIFSVFGLTFCDQNRIFDKSFEIPQSKWSVNKCLTFSVDVTDTTQACNIFVNVRNHGKYEFCNLFLFITITSPDGKSLRDTFECQLADEKGKWLGSGLGDIFTNQILYRTNALFPRKGKYYFRIEQAMRIEELPYIMDVGLRIEKITN